MCGARSGSSHESQSAQRQHRRIRRRPPDGRDPTSGVRDRRRKVPNAFRTLVSRSEYAGPSRYRYRSSTRPTFHSEPHALFGAPPRRRRRRTSGEPMYLDRAPFTTPNEGSRPSGRRFTAVTTLAREHADERLDSHSRQSPPNAFLSSLSRSDAHPPRYTADRRYGSATLAFAASRQGVDSPTQLDRIHVAAGDTPHLRQQRQVVRLSRVMFWILRWSDQYRSIT